MKKTVSVVAFVLIAALLAGCTFPFQKAKEAAPGPEVGSWHGEVNLSDLDLSAEDRAIVSLLAGNVAYEMDVKFFEDYTYSYEMNMDKFKEGIQKSVNTFLGYIMSFNLDLFVNRIVELVLEEIGASNRSSYGTYSVDDTGLITAVGSDTQYFRFASGTLHQLNEEGQIILTFQKNQ